MRTSNLGTRLVLAHVPALIVALLVALLVRRAMDESRETEELKSRSGDAIAASQEFLRAVIDAETGQRGFVITGSEAFLDPYNASVPLADRATAEDIRDIYLSLAEWYRLLAENAEAEERKLEPPAIAKLSQRDR